MDIVIDDGGHQPFQQLITLEELLPHIRAGGVYLCEDIHGGIASYVHGLAHKLNDVRSSREIEDEGIVCSTTPFQQAVASVHLYPFIAIIEKCTNPMRTWAGPRHGSQWQPFYDGDHR